MSPDGDKAWSTEKACISRLFSAVHGIARDLATVSIAAFRQKIEAALLTK
jgi:hypothetical protein